MYIDTTSEDFLKQIELKKERLIEEKMEKGYYDSLDLALVRSTDYLPKNNFVPAICNIPFVTRINDISYSAAVEMHRKQIDSSNYEDSMNLINKMHEYSPLSTQYRSSVHFCLNGVIPEQGHAYGTFSGQIVIIEPFKYHEDDNNILAVRGEDTYFKDGITLSDEAIVLVPEEMNDDISIDDSNPNIVIYKGDKSLATEAVLLEMGIVPEKISQHNFQVSKTSSLANGFLEKKGYCREKHSYHSSYYEDDEKSLVLWEKYDQMFYPYLFDSIGLEDEDALNILKGYYSEYSSKDECISIIFGIMSNIGLERYKEIVNSYNAIIIDKINNGEYPTNNQILEGATLSINDSKSL